MTLEMIWWRLPRKLFDISDISALKIQLDNLYNLLTEGKTVCLDFNTLLPEVLGSTKEFADMVYEFDRVVCDLHLSWRIGNLLVDGWQETVNLDEFINRFEEELLREV